MIAVYTPQITNFRNRVVDSLLGKAQAASETQQPVYLQAAHLVAPGDPAAIEALARYYQKQGNAGAVLDLYERSITHPNQIYLGNLALSLQQYDSALNHFYTASREQQSAASLSGEAQVLFNLDRADQGCEKADTAHKLNLKSTEADGVEAVCALLKSHPTSGSRQDAGVLLQNQVARVGEKWLLAANPKTPNDWLNLARLAAARGDIKLAISRAEEGIRLDQASKDLNQALAEYYRMVGNGAQAQKYQQLYDQLQFHSYQ